MLGYDDPRECPESAYALDRDPRNERIEKHLKDASPHVLRNVKNNVSFVLREGQALGLISPPAPAPEVKPAQFGRRKVIGVLPPLISKDSVAFHHRPYSLPLEQWPTELRRQYDEWKEWVSKDATPSRGYSQKNRPATIENKTRKFEAFFGYLYNVRGIAALDFLMLLDYVPPGLPGGARGDFSSLRIEQEVGLLEEFVNWHREYRLGRMSAQSREVVSVAASVARRFYALRAARNGREKEARRFELAADRIGQFLKRLTVNPVIPKEQRKVGRAELLQAARAEFPRRKAVAGQSGVALASRAARAVALMLLVHHPLRNKHYRGARLSRNLLKKSDGKWYLHFTAEELAAGRKATSPGQQPAGYKAPLDPEVADHLERYLQEWRPRLLQVRVERLKRLRAEQAKGGGSKADSGVISELEGCEDYLFLHRHGGRFTRAGFSRWIEAGTYRWLGVRVNPQLIREIASKDVNRKTMTLPTTQPSISRTPDTGPTNSRRNNSPR